MPRKLTRPSLLDLENNSGTSERARLHWMLWEKPRYEKILRRFEAMYGERPVFWKRSVAREMDLFLTHPENALAVHRQDGSLVLDSRLHRLAWDARMDTLAAERRRHLPPQVCALLDGQMTADEWQPEILQRLYYATDRELELADLLYDMGLGYCLEKERHRGVVRVFGAPDEVNRLFRIGVEQGVILLERQ